MIGDQGFIILVLQGRATEVYHIEAGSILQIEPDILNCGIGFELVSAVNSAKCLVQSWTIEPAKGERPGTANPISETRKGVRP